MSNRARTYSSDLPASLNSAESARTTSTMISRSDLRSAVVVSGTWYFGYGHTFDEKALKELPAGSFYTEPANVDHFAMTKGEVIVQITGYGPTSTKYFDPELDPSRKK